MQGVSFKQYLILRRLYRSQTEVIQIDTDSKDFIYLIENNLIESEKDTETKIVADFPMVYSHDNGLSSITNNGLNLYHSYFDIYVTRTTSVVALIISVIAFIRTIVS